MKYLKIYKFILILIVIGFVSCKNNDIPSTKSLKNKTLIEVPKILNKLAFGVSGQLDAYIVIDGDIENKKLMDIDFIGNGNATVEFSDLSLAPHTIMIYYEYTIDGNDFMLASAFKNIDLTSGSSNLIFSANEYDLDSFDNDGDGINNAQELVAGKIPVLNANTVAPVFSVDDRVSVNVIEDEIETNYTANASDDGGTVTYRLVGGVDIDKFDLHPDTGVLTFKQAPDFENPGDSNGNNTYLLGIMAADGVNQIAKSLTVKVTHAEYKAPIANAGENISVFKNDFVTLSASDSIFSNDTTNRIYKWSIIALPDDSTIVLSDETAEMPTFTIDTDGIDEQYIFQLIVSDGVNDSEPDQIVITTGNTEPNAIIEADNLNKKIGDVVTFNGLKSNDTNQDEITYRWTILKAPAGSNVTLQSINLPETQLTIDVSTKSERLYTVQLIVNDGDKNSEPVTVDIMTVNTPPVANIATNLTSSPRIGDIVIFNGTGSSDVNGDGLTYRWKIKYAPQGSNASIKITEVGKAQLTIDTSTKNDNLFGIELIVNDGIVDSEPKVIEISISNVPPVANAGNNQTVSKGDMVILNGTASTDKDGDDLSYNWTIKKAPAGSTATIETTGTGTAQFTVDASAKRGELYTIQLVVNDGTIDSKSSVMSVTIGNTAPVANAGVNQRVNTGNTVRLNGTGSSDFDGDTLSYSWSFKSKPLNSKAIFNTTDKMKPTFRADVTGTYSVKLTLGDGIDVSTDVVTITVEKIVICPDLCDCRLKPLPSVSDAPVTSAPIVACP